eukprot:c23350_g1_i1 orf=236-889(+)
MASTALSHPLLSSPAFVPSHLNPSASPISSSSADSSLFSSARFLAPALRLPLRAAAAAAAAWRIQALNHGLQSPHSLSFRPPLFPPPTSPQRRRLFPRFPSSIRALEVDQDMLVAIGVGLAGVSLGIGIPVFYEIQAKSAANRENDQPCFPCKGTGTQTCRFCVGSGAITLQLGGGEDKEVLKCINCEGTGSITCTTCQGSGIQPRYLDRREFKDDD